MPVRRLLFILVLAGCSASRPASDTSSRHWVEAVDASDTQAAVAAVQAVLEEAGVEFEGVFGWDLAPYDQPLNYYDTATSRVTLGRAPSGGETDSYWQIYSDRLTGGTWRADIFFRDAEEARRMASFNQAYLAAHEAGHALAYHYSVNPPWDDVPDRPNQASVHCQELLADQVAAAFLATVIESYPRADAYRQRYLELMASLDAAIPNAQRVRLTSLDTCSETPVLAPQDEATFQSYASAFFARQQRLLTRRQRELATVLDEHILWRRASFVTDVPDLPGTVVTSRTPDRAVPPPSNSRGDFPSLLALSRELLVEHASGDYTTETGTAYGLAADGTVYVVETSSTMLIDSSAAEAPYTNADLVSKTTIHIDSVEVVLPDLGASMMAVVQSVAVLAEGDVLALVGVVDVRADDVDWTLPASNRLLRIRQLDGVWRADAGPEFLRTGSAGMDGESAVDDVMVVLDGSVFAESGGRLYPVDLAQLTPAGDGQPVDSNLGDLQALDAQGRRLSVRHDVVGSMVPNGGLMSRLDAGGLLVRSGSGGAMTLAGSGLAGYRDGPGPNARFGRVLATRAVADGVVVVEWSAGIQVRHIRLSQP